MYRVGVAQVRESYIRRKCRENDDADRRWLLSAKADEITVFCTVSAMTFRGLIAACDGAEAGKQALECVGDDRSLRRVIAFYCTPSWKLRNTVGGCWVRHSTQ